ncbi:tRNA dihydrouridine synthase DusB [Caldichromatium japonicum]
MAGVADRPFRTLCRRLGAALAVSEMLTAQTALWTSPKSVARLDHHGEPGPIVVQLLGTDPELLAEAARLQVDRGAQIIDLNLSCPAKKVCRTGAGAALLRDELKVAHILEAVVGAVAVPVTLKIRTGDSPETRNALRIAEIAQASGIAALTVHGRTTACGYDRPAEHETARLIRARLSIPLIANGDIDSPESVRRVLSDTDADGLMIGRAALGRPWIFREILTALSPAATQGKLDRDGLAPDLSEYLTEHLESIYALYGEARGVRVARKHLGWYCRRLSQDPGLGARINQSASAREQHALLRELLAGDWAKAGMSEQRPLGPSQCLHLRETWPIAGRP